MFSKLKDYLTRYDRDEEQLRKEQETTDEQVKVSFAALFVEAASADDEYTSKERALILTLLKHQLKIDDEEALKLRSIGESAQARAHDLHRFTRDVKLIPEDQRVEFVENLWRIILLDEVRDPFEDTLMRRLCGLIYLSDRQSAEARLRVQAQMDAKDTAPQKA